MTATAATTVELDIRSIAAGGDGVGRIDRLVVFVPRTAPGDRARVRIDAGKRFARGVVEELLQPSPDRIEPPCAHYRDDRCGGCQLQHLNYDAQLSIKSSIVRDAIARIGKRALDPPEVVSSPRQWRYRAKLTLAMRRRGAEWLMGLHPYEDAGAVFQLEDCPITDERVVATWREIFATASHLPRANELRGSVRLVANGEGRAVVIEGGTSWTAVERFFAGIPSASALWWKPENAARQLVAKRSEAPAGASFVQINDEVATVLRRYVLSRVRAHHPATVVDAYAGSGDTAVALAEGGARVTAIEVDPDAAARCGARLPRSSRSLAGRVEEHLPRALPADVVLVNPPRGGVHEAVTTQLERHTRAIRAIVYVSCDPATLARDLTRLPSYAMTSVVAFDMFPQTAHVETVCELVPGAATA